MTQITPKRFGKYLLLDQIAVGGMAELYRAMITGVQGFEKLIAVKKILPHLTIEAELVNSFIDEAKLAALLHHQNIVQIYDFGSVEKSYFIAMEYLFGKDLRDVTEKAKKEGSPLSLEYALYIVSRVASGLHYAHNLKDFQGKPLNIIHRDISPQNIFVTYEGDVKIVDFGIAKAATQSTMTQVGMIKGKVAYMSPEQADGKAIDYRSDIFSLGIILYELLTGEKMFQGDTMQILSKVRLAEFPPPEQVIKDVPDKLYEILNQALAKEPEKRYSSCNQMLSDVEEAMYSFTKRPTARGLSEYMKGLFEGEIAEEERTMSALAGMDFEAAAEAKPVSPGKKEEKKKAGAVSTPDEKKKGFPKNLLLAAVGGIVVIVGLVIIFWPGEKPVPPEPESAKTTVAEQQGKEAEKQVEVAQEEPASAKEQEAAKPPEAAPVAKGMEKLEEARQALDEKRYADAINLFEAALAENPDLKQNASAAYEEALREEANSLSKTEVERAEGLLLKAVEVNPGSVKTHSKLGLLYMRQKKYAEAIRAYKTVTELDPGRTDAFFNLGYLYAVKKNYADAERMYQRVVDLKPDYLDEALFNLAMVQKRLGNKDVCIANLEKALAVNPKNERVKNYLNKLRKQ
ncbi:MAG: protein kinase [Deltaproteobacteria bacterium]|nr:protein kinase [Deltaproteobacteria bacterium]